MGKLPDIVFSSWGGGLYLDRWAGLHFLAGSLLAFASQFFGLSWRGAVVMTLAVLVAWEIVERSFGIYEPGTNSVVDLLVGLAGFFVLFVFLVPNIGATGQHLIAALLFVVFVVLSVVAWRLWFRHHADEESAIGQSETVGVEVNKSTTT